MANNPYVNKVQLADGTTLIDISDTTAVASDVAQGKYFYTLAGQKVQGTATGGSEDGSVYQDANGYIVLSDEQGTHVEIDALSVTQNGTYTASTGHAYSPVTVNVSSGISIDDIATNTQPSGAITLGSGVTAIGNYAFYNKPITSIIAPNVTNVGQYSFEGTQITSLDDTNFPSIGVNSSYTVLLRMASLTSIKLSGAYIRLDSGTYALRYNTNLITAEFPNCAKNVGSNQKALYQYAFGGCTKLERVDAGFVTSIAANAFNGATAFNTLILRSTSVVSLANVNAFTNTCFKSGGTGGTIYIPKTLYDALGDGTSSDYQNASNWSTVYGYGTITWAKIEGSIYE